ncbi:hypothetical protein LG902_004830 [Escherichia coli]|nr:hypothetical protein [Escherichia coli]
MKQMSLIEMDGFLKGKCIPRDLKVNETNAEYLVRKFAEAEAKISALAAENARYSMSAGQADQRMSESCAVREVLGFNRSADDVSPSDLVDKIKSIIAECDAIRSAHPQPLGPVMDAAIDAFNAEEMPETGMLNAYFILRDSITVQTPQVDAFLAEVRAKAFNDLCSVFVKHASVSGLDDGDCVTVKEATDALLHCAEQLHEGVHS